MVRKSLAHAERPDEMQAVADSLRLVGPHGHLPAHDADTSGHELLGQPAPGL